MTKLRLWMLGCAVASSPAMAKVTTSEIGKFDGECVAYARAMVWSLPYGLTSWSDKLKVLKPTGTCKAGSIALISLTGDLAKYGHVAYVESCDKSKFSITEANWRKGKKTRRVATGGSSELNIVGYWHPKK